MENEFIRSQPVVKYKGSITFEPSTVNAATIKDFSMDVSLLLFVVRLVIFGLFAFPSDSSKIIEA